MLAGALPLVVTTLQAQSDSRFYCPLTLAPADAAGGGGAADDEKAKAAELAKKLQNNSNIENLANARSLFLINELNWN